VETRLRRAVRAPWTQQEWEGVTTAAARAALESSTDDRAARAVGKHARAVLRAYSTSFFVVTRFLPPLKRERVEAIYAAVRFPDEIVDTFPLSSEEKSNALDEWANDYDRALTITSVQAGVRGGVSPFTALFASVVRTCGIPHPYYRSFLDAMRFDAEPRRFVDLEDLIESYIYGSAIVVGYFLAHVYGSSSPGEWNRAMRSARQLAIGLQLTNFLRDVGEDQRRGRLYLPLDLLMREGIGEPDVSDPRQHEAFARVLRKLAATAEEMYAASAADLDAFAPDSRTAIHACIRVYRQLNERIGRSPQGILHREHVPFTEKVRVLPTSKYWKLPIAYLAS
jgi:phytoene synthase